jgi:hypothetical protein
MEKMSDAVRDRLAAYKNDSHTANEDDPHAAALLEAGYIREVEDEEAAAKGQKRHEITEEGDAALSESGTDSNT